jgi:hypothetical protein
MAMEIKYELAKQAISTLSEQAKNLVTLTTELQISTFIARVQDIDKTWELFTKQYVSVQAAKKAGFDAESHLKEYLEYENKMYEIKGIFDKWMKERNNASSSGGDKEAKGSHVHFSIPKIQLPQFDGDITKYTSFWNIFNSLVHEDVSIPPVQKLHYLLCSLSGEARQLITHLTISNENYLVAVKLLKQRYHNPRIIADKHLGMVMNLPNLSSGKIKLRDFINIINENILALKSLEFNVDDWSFILLYIILRKLTIELQNRFELGVSNSEIPKFTELMEFLEVECRASNIDTSHGRAVPASSNQQYHGRKHLSAMFGGMAPRCVHCNSNNHYISSCNKFTNMTVYQRRQVVKEKRLCWNCLREHAVKDCQSKSTCKVCKRNHHSLLHYENTVKGGESTSNTREETRLECSTSTCHSSRETIGTVLLGTAIIQVRDKFGTYRDVRVLLDSGSQCCLITEKCVARLGLTKHKSSKTVYGIGTENINVTTGEITCTIKPKFSDKPRIEISSLILKSITGNLPSQNISSDVLKKYTNIRLADPDFYKSRPVDMLLGAELFNEVVDGNKISFDKNLPSAYSTIFGWVLLGKISGKSSENSSAMSGCVTLNNLMQRFWETENLPQDNELKGDAEKCEKHFLQTVSRTESGRFMVRLPFKTDIHELGNSYNLAARRFYTLENKLTRNIDLQTEYSKVMAEYLTLGHMERARTSEIKYFLPHHCVIKDTSTSTRVRVVFDASMVTDNGLSLNSSIMPGRKLQNEVMDILIRFRTHSVAFMADIKQMYRQITLHSEDRVFHGVLWRDSPNKPLETYRLTTVTFGVACSPYLAMRCLARLAEEERESFPNASRILTSDTFVDDIVSGGSSIEESIVYRNELIWLLNSAGFELRKWISNKQDFLKDLPHEHCVQTETIDDTTVKVLGINWNPHSDLFEFRNTEISNNTVITKRYILSYIASMYDPCGWIAPVIFTAKVILQELWLLKIGWDERIPEDLENRWKSFASQLNILSHIKIPRLVIPTNTRQYELHGFSDASKMGYAACVYLRVIDDSGSITLHLLLGKTKVAPLKQKLTIPKMELCGAVLLARSLKHVSNLLSHVGNMKMFGWCDSQIVLSWLRTPTHLLKTFESNRVSSIHANLESATWRYVPTSMNAADCATRGIFPENLIEHNLWWTPKWLLKPTSEWPQWKFNLVDYETEKLLPSDMITSNVTRIEQWDIFEKYSSFRRLVNITALCKRFIHNLRNKNHKLSGCVSKEEWNEALRALILQVQGANFHEDLNLIKTGKLHMSKLGRLTPFIDAEGILRVGGRLRNASLGFSSKHPIIIPKNHIFTTLIIRYFHRKNLHTGSSLTLSLIRQEFWIVSGRDAVRREIHKCMQCFRGRAKGLEPMMADLPTFRVNRSKAFTICGMDFGGYFNVKSSNLRNAKVTKAYLCAFVCMVTKAVHLEVVSDLSTPAFLAALDRFVSRRGLCTDLYSDWGSNFVGAESHFRDIFNQPISWNFFQSEMHERKISFHRNPATASHFGGLWESVIKAAKTHLKRVIGETIVTFEELTTLFAKIEAILNSRPLCGMSDNADDLDFLSPGHFLVGQPLVSVPENNWESTKDNHLTRWQLIQKFSQQIWKRWSLEYLHTLQQRGKWTKNHSDIKVNDLVLIKDTNLPPLQWRLGRIVELFPGKDGIVRVVDIKTDTGILRRPVVKVCPLPVND